MRLIHANIAWSEDSRHLAVYPDSYAAECPGAGIMQTGVLAAS